MTTFDKYNKDLHELTEEHAGKRVATATFWLVFSVTWVVGLGILIAGLVVATTYVLPLVAKFPKLPLPQMGNVLLSFGIAVAVVALAGVWLLKTFRRTRDAVVSILASQSGDLGATLHATQSRVGAAAALLDDTTQRVHYLESHAADADSVTDGLRKAHTYLTGNLPSSAGMSHRDALLALLNVGVHSVGHPLTILSAEYRVDGGPQVDVQKLLMSKIRNNRIGLKVTNAEMGGDPQRGAKKVLRVVYQYDDTTSEVRVPEGEELRIPD